ncbi:carboxypeptidase regulatory-like domain-containing protein [Candidatus Parcubacteria bacterium]|nr:MAG: carboxypeptidase regulatory-like domain-containing protein [Candidatus Parcubacteria bacterium]
MRYTKYAIRDTGSRGATLLDTVVGTALMLIVFLGIAAAFQLSLDVVTNNKARAGAIALGNERMEYLRSLSYTQIGVEGGIPAGIVPQEETVSWNGIEYTRRTSVLYADDPGDGLGELDENSIITDYKTIRVEVSWTARQGERSVVLVGRASPNGVEVAVAGGILAITVVNAAAEPVFDAQVDIINTEVSPAINIRTYTNSNGAVTYIGAPAASNYQITVSRAGYSTDQTYPVTAENPNPTPRHLTVADNETTSQTFAIDLVSTKTVETYKALEPSTWEDTFANDTKIAVFNGTEISGGRVRFAGNPPFPPTASVQSIAIAPSQVSRWKTLSWNDVEPSDTEIFYQLYTSDGATLIPDAVLPNNSTGFSTSSVDISTIPAGTYPGLRIGAILKTKNPGAPTPSIDDWTIEYEGPSPFPNLSFSMQGLKTIGNNPTVYKYDEVHSSGAGASLTLQNVEWDTYTLSVPTTTNYALSESCDDPQPETLDPASSQTTQLYVVPYDPSTLLVDVRASGSNALLTGASVRLYKTGYDETLSTSSCGQIFFEGLEEATYSIEVSKTGYQTYGSADVTVFDGALLSVVLISL